MARAAARRLGARAEVEVDDELVRVSVLGSASVSCAQLQAALQMAVSGVELPREELASLAEQTQDSVTDAIKHGGEQSTQSGNTNGEEANVNEGATKDDLTPDWIAKMKVVDLRQHLKERGQSTKGMCMRESLCHSTRLTAPLLL